MKNEHDTETKRDWEINGIRICKGWRAGYEPYTQTPGTMRAAALTHARVGLNNLWAGLVSVEPNTETLAHHHGEQETVMFVVQGGARYDGRQLEYVVDAEPGDFIFIPPYAPHQESNASSDTVAEVVLVRSGPEPVVVNFGNASPEI